MIKNISFQILAALIFVIVGVFLFGSSGHDDSHITYAAAFQLAETGKVLNINGEFIEQGSSLLHVFILAALYKLTALSIPATGVIFSLVMGILCIPLIFVLAAQLKIRQPVLAVALLSLSSAVTYWAVGGLESTLVAFLVMWLMLAIFRFIEQFNIANALHCLFVIFLYLCCRPEAIFVLLLSLGAIFILQVMTKQLWVGKQQLIVLFLLAILAFTVIIAYRYALYQQIFPQPVYAKSGSPLLESVKKLGFGLLYFLYAMQLSIIFYVICSLLWFLKLLKHKTASLLAVIVFAFTLSQLAFVVVSGGDWMAGGRFFVNIVPGLICIALLYLQNFRCYRYVIPSLMLVCMMEMAVLSLLVSPSMGAQHLTQFKKSLKTPLDWQGFDWSEQMNFVHIGDIALLMYLNPLMEELTQHKETVNVLSIQMGMTPYHLIRNFPHKVHITDMRGLATRHLTECAAFEHFPKNWQGIFIQYKDYFSAQQSSECNLPKADLIYDLLPIAGKYNDERLASIRDNGYTVVYLVKGFVKTSFAPKSQNVEAFVAISNELAEKIPSKFLQQSYEFEYK